MIHGKAGEVGRQLEALWATGTMTGLGDAQLLGRFVRGRDAAGELAFRELVRRHGPMVLGVCRQILRHSDDADDAFQATFLVLVRRRRRSGRASRSPHGSTASPAGPPGALAVGLAPAIGMRGRGRCRGGPSRGPVHARSPTALVSRGSPGSPTSTAPRSCSATWRGRRTRRPPAPELAGRHGQRSPSRAEAAAFRLEPRHRRSPRRPSRPSAWPAPGRRWRPRWSRARSRTPRFAAAQPVSASVLSLTRENLKTMYVRKLGTFIARRPARRCGLRRRVGPLEHVAGGAALACNGSASAQRRTPRRPRPRPRPQLQTRPTPLDPGRNPRPARCP